MATRGNAQLSNRLGNGSGRGGSGDRDSVDNAVGRRIAERNASYFLVGMVLFAVVCFILLPVEVMMLMDIKTTNVRSQEALTEAKKIRAELKQKKDNE